MFSTRYPRVQTLNLKDRGKRRKVECVSINLAVVADYLRSKGVRFARDITVVWRHWIKLPSVMRLDGEAEDYLRNAERARWREERSRRSRLTSNGSTSRAAG